MPSSKANPILRITKCTHDCAPRLRSRRSRSSRGCQTTRLHTFSGCHDPYNPDFKKPDKVLPSQTEMCQARQNYVRPSLLKRGERPPLILKDRPPSAKACGERPNNNFATSPPSTHFHKAAHLGSCRGVPDLDESVVRPAGDAIAVRGESHRGHAVRVTRQGVHLPPTHLYLRGWSWRAARFSVRPLVPRRPVGILSGLANILSGL